MPSRRWRPAPTSSSRSRWPPPSPTPSASSRQAKANGRKVVVGYILRHHPSWQRLIAEARALGRPLRLPHEPQPAVLRPDLGDAQALMQTTSPIVDCGVHYVDVMCQITDARPVEVRGMGLRLTDEIAPDMYNYGHLQVLFDDGSVGWYEAGWGPMMSDTAFFVKDVISPERLPSRSSWPRAPRPTTSTPTPRPRLIRLHRPRSAGRQVREPTRCCRWPASPATRSSATASRPSCSRPSARTSTSPATWTTPSHSLARLPRRRRERAHRPAGQALKGPPMGSLNLEDVTKSFGRSRCIKGIDLEVDGRRVRASSSAPRAAASPRCCASSPAWRTPPPATS